MATNMTREPAVVTFEKTIGPGVNVQITGIPAEVLRRDGYDDLELFDEETAGRVLGLLRLARTRMANGETDFHFDFAESA
jgi:hypothetical protein